MPQSWLDKLRDARTKTATSALGWYEHNGQVGFTYPTNAGDPEIAKIYRPHGELAPWLRACKLITDQKRPELDAVVATAFAAPIFHLIGADIACIPICGPSASGKSTALEVAASVWGHPKKSLDIGVARTDRGMINKLGALRHLPLYWDVPLVQGSREMMFDAATMILTQGNTGARSTRGGGRPTLEEVQEFQTIVTMGTHASFWDHVGKDNAALYRTFEITLKASRPSDPGQLKLTEATLILDDLKSNYGTMGLAYAKVLERARAPIRAEAFVTMQWFEHKCATTRPERIWLWLATAIQTGAARGNELGCAFDLDKLRDFLVYQITALRGRLAGVPAGDAGITETLHAFLEHFRTRSVWTNKMIPLTRGGGYIKDFDLQIIQRPEKSKIAQGAHVHYCVGARLIIFRGDTFANFVGGLGLNETIVRRALTTAFNAQSTETTLLRGTPYAHSAKKKVVVIPVPPGSPFEERLFAPTEPPTSGEGLTTGQRSATPGMD